MKSAYEKALERFGPVEELGEEQKQKIAEVTSFYKSKVAEVELGFGDRIAKAKDQTAADELQKQMLAEIAKLNEKADREKDKIRNAGK